MDTKQIIRKWYSLLEFPKKYDEAFEEALGSFIISENTCIENYDFKSTEGAKNLLSYLFMCEKTEQLYREKGLSREVLIDTLKDIRVWTDIYCDTGKFFYLGELGWLKHHLTCELFKLGRLQFAFSTAHCDYAAYGLKKGAPIIEVHIDKNGPLLPEECDSSFAKAGQFFREHFPEYHYKAYTCHSWFLGSNMSRLLPENSNILKFSRRFDIILEEPADDILRYVFKWDTTRENLSDEKPDTPFKEKIIKDVQLGRTFYIGYGAIRPEQIEY